MENKVIGYVRVSTVRQNTENQKLAILEWCNREGLRVDEWIEVEASSRRPPTERRIDEVLARLQEGDTLLVAELSRLGRSVGQIAMLIDELVKRGIKVICLKEGIRLNGRPDIQTKVMVTTVSLFAEIERDLISERTKEGLERARAAGKKIGRPKGPGKSKLDAHAKEIRELLDLGVPKTKIAQRLGTTPANLHRWLKRHPK